MRRSRTSLKKPASETAESLIGAIRGRLVGSFFERVKNGKSRFSYAEIESANVHLRTAMKRISCLPDFALLADHSDSVLASAIQGCRTTGELKQVLHSILELNRDRPKTSVVPPRLRGGEKLRVLIVSGMTPSIMHGGGLRLFDIINELPDSYEIDLYARFKGTLDQESIDKLGHRLSSVKLVKKLRWGEMLKWLSREDRGHDRYDVIQIEYPNAIPLIPHLSRFADKTVFTFMEVVTRSLAIDIVNSIRGGDGNIPPALARRFVLSLCAEASALFRAGATIAVTHPDAEFCQAMGEIMPEIIPTGISSEILRDASQMNVSEQFQGLPKAASFVGYYKHPPNVDAVRWYLRNVHPIVLKRIPDFKVYIIGGGDGSELKREFAMDPSIEFTGWVERLGPWIAKGSICISPLISGAGARGKINQYSAYKRPSVSTAIGISGMDYKDGESVLVADDPEVFADAMIRLMTEEALWSRIHAGSQEVITQSLWPRLIQRVCDIYES